MSDKKNNKNFNLNRFNTSFSRRSFKSGAYASVISAVVIALVLLVNLIINEFDLKIDISSEGIYTLTDNTKEYIKGLEDDVTLYYLIEAGKEAPMFLKIAQKFESFSDRIALEQVDPIQYPTFSSEYVDDEVSLNSFLVINNNTKRAKYVDYNDMLIKKFSEQTYQLEIVGVDIEGQLISAIQYVTNPKLPTVYYTVGHDEPEIGPIFKDIMSRMNIDIQPLETFFTTEMPEDCDVLIINAPTEDFSDSEIETIKQYMAAGGNVVIAVNYLAKDLENLNLLIDYYGVQIEDGIIHEGDPNHFIPLFPRFLVPKVLKHDITDTLYNGGRFVIAPVSSGLIIKSGIRSSLTVEPLLQTSDKAYSKVDISSGKITMGEDDIPGPFNIGLISSDTYEGVTSNMVIFSSAEIFEDNMLADYGNIYLLVDTIGSLVGEIETIAVRPRYLYPKPLNITQKPVIIWATLTIIAAPILILATGIFIVIRRRRR
ncbi:MAG TPA: GldG family protein [Clostridiales bacterium]|jgi:ABC-2 type transport system permease protein|nr:GldG family protein [Clostridiales bacterium]